MYLLKIMKVKICIDKSENFVLQLMEKYSMNLGHEATFLALVPTLLLSV